MQVVEHQLILQQPALAPSQKRVRESKRKRERCHRGLIAGLQMWFLDQCTYTTINAFDKELRRKLYMLSKAVVHGIIMLLHVCRWYWCSTVRCEGEQINREIEIDVLRATQTALSTRFTHTKKTLSNSYQPISQDGRIKAVGQICPQKDIWHLMPNSWGHLRHSHYT